MNKKVKIVILILFILILLSFVLYRYAFFFRRYNVVLMVSDTLRADTLGCYGGEAHTPNIDWLAKQGVLFDRAYTTAPWTSPAAVGIFTGEYPDIYKKNPKDEKIATYHVPGANLLLAEALRDTGYDLRMDIENVLASMPNALQGFKGIGPHRRFLSGRNTRLLEDISKIRPESEYHEKMYGSLNVLLNASKDQPFFLVKWFLDPHAPLDPPKKYVPKRIAEIEELVDNFRKILFTLSELPDGSNLDSIENCINGVLADIDSKPPYVRKLYEKGLAYIAEHLQFSNEEIDKIAGGTFREGLENIQRDIAMKKIRRKLYNAEVEFVDERVGYILELLRFKNLFSRTYIIFMADHGESMGEHGMNGHGKSLYESEVRVPLIIAGPGIPHGRREQTMVSLLGLMPTVKDLLGITYEEDIQGKSFSKLLLNRPFSFFSIINSDDNDDNLVYCVEVNKKRSHQDALIKGDYKLITFKDDTYELFNLSEDPEEQKDISRDNPEVVKQMLKRIAEMREKNIKRRAFHLNNSENGPQLDQKTLEQIRALGYLE